MSFLNFNNKKQLHHFIASIDVGHFDDEYDKQIEAFKQALSTLEVSDHDRVARYAHDLLSGLNVVRNYPQGVAIFGSARLKENSRYCRSARKLGQFLAENGHTVITGGGPGIMEAANRGAFEAGGRSIGLNITLPHEQQPNPYLTDTLTFRYFFARKVMLAMSANIYVFFPGGFGTMDEFSEILLLMQEGKMQKMPIFLFGKAFWRPLDRFYADKLRPLGLINAVDRKLYQLTDSVEEIVETANRVLHTDNQLEVKK